MEINFIFFFDLCLDIEKEFTLHLWNYFFFNSTLLNFHITTICIMNVDMNGLE